MCISLLASKGSRSEVRQVHGSGQQHFRRLGSEEAVLIWLPLEEPFPATCCSLKQPRSGVIFSRKLMVCNTVYLYSHADGLDMPLVIWLCALNTLKQFTVTETKLQGWYLWNPGVVLSSLNILINCKGMCFINVTEQNTQVE